MNIWVSISSDTVHGREGHFVLFVCLQSQEESKGNSRQRFNGRHFHSWLHDVDEKYEKIKVSRTTYPCCLENMVVEKQHVRYR